MSSTGRGGDRVEFDDYPTPAWAVRRLIEGVRLPGGLWLEPSSGAGSIVRAVEKKNVRWLRLDVNPVYRDHVDLVTDFTCFDGAVVKGLVPDRGFDVCISNPPYRLAMEFIQQGLKLARYVVMLLRLNFLESESRRDWLNDHMPELAVLPNRPSFRTFVDEETGKRSTSDSCAYSWFIFRQAGVRRVTDSGLVILESTPLRERRVREVELMNDIPGDLFSGIDV